LDRDLDRDRDFDLEGDAELALEIILEAGWVASVLVSSSWLLLSSMPIGT
jgi:hypothetical protein